jgi:NADH-quinone oxidoreductase subunit A
LETSPSLWPWLVYSLFVVLSIAGMLITSYVLGQRHSETDTAVPYESGITPTFSARLRFPVNFYIVAMLFIIFDLESVFIIAWAIVAKELGWAGFIEASLFIVILGIALLYLWRVKALDFGPSAKRKKQ